MSAISQNAHIYSLSADNWRAKRMQTALLCSAIGIEESQVRVCQEPSSMSSQLRFSAPSQLSHWQQQIHTYHMAHSSLALSVIILILSLQSKTTAEVLTVFEEHAKYNVYCKNSIKEHINICSKYLKEFLLPRCKFLKREGKGKGKGKGKGEKNREKRKSIHITSLPILIKKFKWWHSIRLCLSKREYSTTCQSPKDLLTISVVYASVQL